MKRAALLLGYNYRGNRAIREMHAGSDLVNLGGFFNWMGFDIVQPEIDLPRQQVLNRIDQLLHAPRTPADRLHANDLLIIYFAGHGLQDAEQMLVVTSESPKAPFDLITVRDLRQRAEGLGLHIVMILDACRDSGMTTNTARSLMRNIYLDTTPLRDLAIESLRLDSSPNTPRGSLTLFCACADGQQAHEIGQTGMGLFSKAFVNVLKRLTQAGKQVRVDDDLRDQVEDEMTLLGGKAAPQPTKYSTSKPPVLIPAKTPNSDPAPTPKAQPKPSKPTSKLPAFDPVFVPKLLDPKPPVNYAELLKDFEFPKPAPEKPKPNPDVLSLLKFPTLIGLTLSTPPSLGSTFASQEPLLLDKHVSTAPSRSRDVAEHLSDLKEADPPLPAFGAAAGGWVGLTATPILLYILKKVLAPQTIDIWHPGAWFSNTFSAFKLMLFAYWGLTNIWILSSWLFLTLGVFVLMLAGVRSSTSLERNLEQGADFAGKVAGGIGALFLFLGVPGMIVSDWWMGTHTMCALSGFVMLGFQYSLFALVGACLWACASFALTWLLTVLISFVGRGMTRLTEG